MNESSPFVLDVGKVLREGMPEPFLRVGDSPDRIGAEMIAVEPGTEVTVEGMITPLGGGVLVDADVRAPLTGQCVRCLADLVDTLGVHVSAVFSASEDFITGEDAEEGDEIARVIDDKVDMTQAVIDEAVLALPFNPTCELIGAGECSEAKTGVPAPDGVSGEEERVDPRWAGLAEKFGNLSADDADEGDKK